jgi:acetylornithine deacetylase/succinyl-diaminopimelate desuccinylase
MNNELIYKRLDSQELLGIAGDLIRIPSHFEVPGEESEIVCHLEGWLRRQGFDVQTTQVFPDRKNLIVRLPGQGKGKSLALNGHLDTVPPGSGMTQPYAPVIKDGRLYGRGACDMKGAVAAMLYAFLLLKRHNVELAGDLIFTGVIGEETGGTGTRHLVVKGGFRPDFAVVGEPTDMNIVISHKGVANLEAIVHGISCHASMPDLGANAITAACTFVQNVRERLAPALRKRTQEHVGCATVSVGVIKGGTKISMVADRCSVLIDRRWVDGETEEKVSSELADLLREACARDRRLSCEVRSLLPPGGYYGPFRIPEEHPLVSTARQVLGTRGLPASVGGMQGWTDAATLMHAGVPVILLGPGSVAEAHNDGEYVEVRQLVDAVGVYLSLAETICGWNKVA